MFSSRSLSSTEPETTLNSEPEVPEIEYLTVRVQFADPRPSAARRTTHRAGGALEAGWWLRRAGPGNEAAYLRSLAGRGARLYLARAIAHRRRAGASRGAAAAVKRIV